MPSLQVILLTYNHEKYIERALKGIAKQKVNFDLEVLLLNDFSQDATEEVIDEFKKSSSLKITVFKNHVNLGILESVKFLLNKVTASYIAILDGDDFWNYEHKLQTQFDFLEKNPDYNGCYHDAAIDIESEAAGKVLFKGAKMYSQQYNYKEETHLADLLERLIIPTSSLVSRTTFINEQNLSLLKDNYSIAWKLTCLSINKSKFYYINEVWSNYTNHIKGFSKKNNLNFHNSHLRFLNDVKPYEDFKFNKVELYNSMTSEIKLIIERENLSDLKKIRYVGRFILYRVKFLIRELIRLVN